MAPLVALLLAVVSYLPTSSDAVNVQVNAGLTISSTINAVNVHANAGVNSSTSNAAKDATAVPSKPLAPPPPSGHSTTALPEYNTTAAAAAASASGELVSPTGGHGSYKGMSREILDAHNQVRARYGVPPMKWDDQLARQARRWSEAMRKDCQLKHSSVNMGESIYVNHYGWNATAKDALRSWTSEESLYDKKTGGCIAGHPYKDCGHFVLMVGKDSQRIGCWRAECFKGGVFITCNYNRD